ncbi:MAG: hypothetical protein ABJK59_09930 [Erythrobacter sp.]|uniref:hypothetical protein n=1 Tax=Erythrobacter sp. TaxID=1042 RepID=UPI0032968A49
MFDKLDAYNIVANLIPGAALTYGLHASGFPTPHPSEELGAFLLVAFVAGVMTNRIGSIVIDPLLRAKSVGFLHPKNYKAFVTSQRDDPKLDTIVANTGLYRTFVTAGLLFLLLVGIDRLIKECGISSQFVFIAFVVIGIIVSAFALKKEDDYIHERISQPDSRKDGD